MQGGVKERGNWKGHSFGGDARRCVGNDVAFGGVRNTWRSNISTISLVIEGLVFVTCFNVKLINILTGSL